MKCDCPSCRARAEREWAALIDANYTPEEMQRLGGIGYRDSFTDQYQGLTERIANVRPANA